MLLNEIERFNEIQVTNSWYLGGGGHSTEVAFTLLTQPPHSHYCLVCEQSREIEYISAKA